MYANPLGITDCLKARLKEDSHVYSECEINPEDYSSSSKVLKIKYLEKTYPLNDICHFRLEVPAYPELILENIYLECELMHSELIKSTKSSSASTKIKEVT